MVTEAKVSGKKSSENRSGGRTEFAEYLLRMWQRAPESRKEEHVKKECSP